VDARRIGAGAIAVAVAIAIAGACDRSPTPRQLDLDLVTVGGARLRTDVVGSEQFAERATFVLVDADNQSDDGAYVTLAGQLMAGSAVAGDLTPQSLWVPAHGERTFALVDSKRMARPDADGGRIMVRGAAVDTPPVARVDDVKDMDDYGKRVVQGELVNEADRPGTAVVIASFHDAHGKPMTRPFELVPMTANGRQAVQFVGPVGSVKGEMYVGDVVY
jgi:hypothetical protein